MKAKCKICNKEFIKKVGNQIYCSKDCQNEAIKIKRRKNTNKTCILCGGKMPKGKIKYCSKRCYEFVHNSRSIIRKKKNVEKIYKTLNIDKTKFRKKYSDDEVKFLIEKKRLGYTNTYIAKKLKRTLYSVEAKISQLRRKGVLL